MSAGRGKFIVRALDEHTSAAPVCELDALPQQLPSLAAVVATPQSRAEVDQRPRMLEPGWRILEHINCLSQQLLADRSTLDETEHAQRNSDRARCAPATRQLEFLARKRLRFVGA